LLLLPSTSNPCFQKALQNYIKMHFHKTIRKNLFFHLPA